MEKQKRLFVAISLNAEIVQRCIMLRESYPNLSKNRALNWTKPQNLHLTLSFLGDTDISLIPNIIYALDTSLAQSDNFTLQFKGLGCFPNVHKPRILWMGIEDPITLLSVYKRVTNTLKPILPLNRQRFSPHITLARIKDFTTTDTFTDISTLVNQNLLTDFGKQLADYVTLYESHLQPGGPIYKSIHKTMLK